MQCEVNGVRIVYEDAGSGDPVVLIHGFPFSRRMWRLQLPALQERFRVIAPDLRGHGESGVPPGPYSMGAMAGDVAALLDRLSIQKAVLVGLSMGGYVALAFCRRWPGRVSALVLADTKAEPDTPEGKQARDELVAAVCKVGMEAVVQRMLPRLLSPKTLQDKPEVAEEVKSMMLATQPEGAIGALQGMRDRPDSTDVLRSIECPVLCVCGEDDVLSPPSTAQAMASIARSGKAEVISSAGHLPNMENPETFNRVLLAFLSD
ncbi:MAG: alpha/beta fold hydrolase [Armatimonadota bacterium]